jgi:hypothetical protein
MVAGKPLVLNRQGCLAVSTHEPEVLRLGDRLGFASQQICGQVNLLPLDYALHILHPNLNPRLNSRILQI